METRKSTKLWRWAAYAACTAIAATVIGAPDPDSSLRSALAIHDFGHVVAFGLVTALFAFALSTRSRLTLRGRVAMTCLAAGAALALGAAVEIVQAASGQNGDPWDVMRDGGGAFSAALILTAFDPGISARMRTVLASVAVLGLIALAYPVFAALDEEAAARAQFPVLAGFESASELSRFHFSKKNKPQMIKIPGADGQPVPAVKLNLPPGRYPGFGLKYFPRDWRGMRALQLLIVNPQPTPFNMTVRIDDAGYDYKLDLDDRYNRSFPLEPGANRIEIPLSDVAMAPLNRRFDLGHVKSLYVYAVDLEQSRNIFVGPIVLLH